MLQLRTGVLFPHCHAWVCQQNPENPEQDSKVLDVEQVTG